MRRPATLALPNTLRGATGVLEPSVTIERSYCGGYSVMVRLNGERVHSEHYRRIRAAEDARHRLERMARRTLAQAVLAGHRT